MSQIASDLRHAVRMLTKNPGFTALAVLALGIGIGANASIYSLADALLYRPLLLPDLDRAVQVYGVTEGGSDLIQSMAAGDFQDFKRDSKTLDHLSAFAFTSVALSGEGDPEVVSAYRVSPSLFDALAGRAVLGRSLLPGDGQQDGDDRVVVLSHGLWMSHFGADPGVIHRRVALEGESYQVVGVMQKEFRFPADAQLWIPLRFTNDEVSARGRFIVNVAGRLKQGVSFNQANTEIRMLARRLAERLPGTHRNRGARVVLIRESVSGELTGGFTRMLIGAVAFLLMIACSNVANLQFARVSMRGREIAVRTAMGARRWDIVRHLLAESLVLSGLGVAAGVLIASWGLDLLHRGMPPEVSRYVPGWHRIGLNLPVLAITVAVALSAGILSGIVPAWLGSRVDISNTLKEGSRASAGRTRHRLRGLLVVSEIVLSLVLLIGAGLLAKGLRNVGEPGPDMDPAHVLEFEVGLPPSRFATIAGVRDFERDLLNRTRSLPGVVAASLVTDVPFSGSSRTRTFRLEGHAAEHLSERPFAQIQSIDSQYFRTMRIPLLRGREFKDTDGENGPGVAIVTPRWVQLYGEGRDPLGRRIQFGGEGEYGPWLTIVGVASDVLHEPFERLPRATVYQPYPQAPVRSVQYVLRTSGDPLTLGPTVRSLVASIQPGQPVGELKTFAKTIHDTLLGFEYVAVLMGIFGAVALLLSAIGVYAVMAYSVNERTHEIGLRMALGARPVGILWMVGKWGVSLAAIGMGIGIPAALALSKLLSGLLIGVSAFDVPMFAAGVMVLGGAALAACYVPVRRAVSVDPMVTLRSQ